VRVCTCVRALSMKISEWPSLSADIASQPGGHNSKRRDTDIGWQPIICTYSKCARMCVCACACVCVRVRVRVCACVCVRMNAAG